MLMIGSEKEKREGWPPFQSEGSWEMATDGPYKRLR